MSLSKIFPYFPTLTTQQIQQFEQLFELYQDWNSKINVISRKDIDNLYIHHVLHSLSIAKVLPLKAYTRVLDVGTGGGFPGIPLAILFPEALFHLIDARAKKIKVVNAVADSLGLTNVKAEHLRVESLFNSGKVYDFVLSRGVSKLSVLHDWSRRLVNGGLYNNLPNGLLALKGGDLRAEIKQIRAKVKVFPIQDFFDLPFFSEKHIVYVPVR